VGNPIFLNYSQEELNRNFDQRAWASNALEVIARYAKFSAETRERFQHRSAIPYGADPDEVLDFFPAGRPGAPIQIFVHGGAWKNFTKDDYSFVADAFIPYGVSTAVINFSKLPNKRLPAVVEQICQAIEWVFEHSDELNGGCSQLYVSAQSSGAHLAAAALQRGAFDLVDGAALVSGPYFLVPVMLSHRAEYVKLEQEEVIAFSPGLHPDKMDGPVLLVYAQHDTNEFRRQTQEFASGLAKERRLIQLIDCPSVNHFELMECFGNPRHQMMQAIFEQMGIRADSNV
jgi:arylformamidase